MAHQFIVTMRDLRRVHPPDKEVLRGINISMYPGAKIGVLGLNGSGKSTVLRIMAGLDTEIEGEATPMPNLNIGYLPQEPQLDPGKTVREVVEMGLSDVLDAQSKLEAVYVAYADEGADFEALANEQARL
jgi:sulfate-transporting ATPase